MDVAWCCLAWSPQDQNTVNFGEYVLVAMKVSHVSAFAFTDYAGFWFVGGTAAFELRR